jgi:hypothetical protein
MDMKETLYVEKEMKCSFPWWKKGESLFTLEIKKLFSFPIETKFYFIFGSNPH